MIARGERATNTDGFVEKVLLEIAEKTKREDFDGGARAVDDALAEASETIALQIGTVTSNGTSLTLTPTATFDVIAQESNKTPAQIARRPPRSWCETRHPSQRWSPCSSRSNGRHGCQSSEDTTTLRGRRSKRDQLFSVRCH